MLEKDYDRFEKSIKQYNPSKVIILGDLFHSVHNLEWELLKDFIDSFDDIRFQLVMGNHDILSKNQWHDSKFEIFKDSLIIPPFILTHYPMEEAHEQYYNLAGHIHPGVRLSGGPAQSLRLPCFYFNKFQGILPAFGDFTGNFKVKPRSGDRVIAIADKQLILFT
jgi:DNA ligase-associated metallophosphoesterase